MKNKSLKFKVLALAFIFFTTKQAMAQTYDCGNVNDPPQTPTYDSAWRSQSQPGSCKELTSYIDTTTGLTFKVNFHFFRPTTGSVYYNTYYDFYKNATAAHCDTLIKLVNYRISHLQAPDIAATPPVTNNYVNPHIQFQRMGVYTHTTDSAWMDPWGFSSSPHYSYAQNANSEINIYFTADTSRSGTGFGAYGHVVMSAFQWLPTQWCGNCLDSTFVGTFLHELGHTAGLLGHTDAASSWGINLPQNCFFPMGGTTDYYDEPSSGPCWGNVASVSQGGCASNNIMGYNHDRTYLSPNQIGSFYYSVYAGINTKFTTSSIPSNKCAYDSTKTINITTNTTWDKVVVTNGDVVIQAGKTLTIKCTAVFSTGSRVIVQPTAKLIIDGGTLTSYCGIWPGVQVRGNKNNNQLTSKSTGLPLYQGIVVMINGGTIQNAQVGITTIAKFNNGNQDWNQTGGIIQATGANFSSNVKDIEFLYYQQINTSYFANCAFIPAGQPAGGWPDARVSLHAVKGVKFLGSTFRSTTGSLQDNGITSNDAGFTVDNYSTISTSYFEKYKYAIHAQNTTIFDPINIDSATFYNNFIGAFYGSQVNYSTITYSTFKVNYAFSSPSTPDYGIYLDQSNGYSVRKNSFLGNTGTWTSHPHSGIYINASGTGSNSCYNNYFQDLNYGLNPQEQNQGSSGATGLIMNCNDFVNCKFNISVLGTLASTGVLKQQGSLTNQNLYVRNTYQAPACGSQNLYSISTNQGFQLWHPSFTGSTYQPTPQQSCSDSTKVRVYQLTGTYNKATQCPDNCTGCRTIGEVENNIKLYEGQLLASRNNGSEEDLRKLEDELNYEKNELGLLSNERIRNFLNDTSLVNPMDSVVAELKHKRNPNYKKILFGAYLTKGDVVRAQNYLDSARNDEPSNLDLYDIQTEMMHKESDPLGYIHNLKNNPNLKGRLLTMANDRSSEGCTQAQALLSLAFGMKFQEPILLPESLNGSRLSTSEDEEMSIYPNPAQNSLSIVYNISEGKSAQVNVVDLTGRIVVSTVIKGEAGNHKVDVSGLKNGVYFVSLQEGNKVIANKKVIIIK